MNKLELTDEELQLVQAAIDHASIAAKLAKIMASLQGKVECAMKKIKPIKGSGHVDKK